jgi:Chaperone of endosialidase
MKLHETTYDKQSFFTSEGKSGSLSGLIRTKSLAWIPLLSLLVLLALPAATFAQNASQAQRVPDRKTVKGQLPEPIVLGTSAQTVQIPGGLNVGNGRLEVVTSAIGGGVLTNNLYIRQLDQPGSPAHLCWRVAPDRVPGLMLTTCTSSESSLRYKTDLQPFLGGLDVVTRLKPYNFAWKNTGMREIGLIAEDVAEVEPLFTYKNDKDEIEGVKYENLNVIFVNAFKEQQAQIEELRKQIKAQQEQLKQQAQQIEALKKPVSP